MPREYLKIIESKSKVRQSRAKAVVAKVSTSSSTPAISSNVAELKDMVKALLLDKKNQSPAPTPSSTPAPVKAVEPNYVTCGGAHSYQNCPATNENAYPDNIQEYVSQAAATNYNQGHTSFRPQMVANQIRPPGFPPYQNNQNNFNRGNNFNQNRGGNFNQSNFNPSSFNQGQLHRPQGITTRSGVAYQGPKTPSPSKQGTKVTKDQVQTPSSQNTTPVQPSVIQSESQAPIFEPIVAPVSAPMANLKPSIPYPSRRDNEKRRNQANEQIEKFYEIFKDMSFEISFTDALILMPKFASTLKALIGNKEKLSEVARTPMNEHCSAVILNKLPRKLRDPSKFLIPCEFPGMDECLALADLGASINLMPFFVWEALSLLKLTPTCMTLELADHFEPDPRVPLILGRCFLKTGRALIDVHKGELTLRIRKEAITYNLDQTVSGNPTPYDDLIVSTTSPTLTLFGDIDLLLFEEADAFLVNHCLPSPIMNNICLRTRRNSKAKTIKSSVDEPPEVELKDLPHHLEYAFLEGDNKLPVIITKELGDEEKSALIMVLKSHKRAIA
nr:reverse transcriptase domain-containing protein [Tanacetum cinerariifolium]